ncbi:MAG TPA: GNAT family N-acetyltransferase, partial [Rhodothermales bacterium]|nr:GNAT family N-acetyltransferase [Rhodothermales bacterium]
DAAFDLVLRDGKPIGRLYVERGGAEIHVIELSLLPEARGAGLGTQLLTALLEEGAASGRTVAIHVEKFNPALRLYQRLGFEVADDRGVYWYMERRPVAEGEGEEGGEARGDEDAGAEDEKSGGHGG